MSNKGVEIALNFNPISTDDFDVNIGGNIAFNKTRIEELGIPLKDFYIDWVAEQRSYYFGAQISRGQYFRTPANVFVEGEETSLFYGLQTNGIYQTDDTDIVDGAQPGDVRIVDQNEDGVIDIFDRTFIGNPNPDFVYGFNLNFKYKRFTTNFLFNGVYGNDIANGNLIKLNNAEGLQTNISPNAYNNAWRPDAQTNLYPRIGYEVIPNQSLAVSDRIIEDGSFLRLNNVTLSYDIPVDKIKMVERFNIYVAGQNLVTWTSYSGYNPEV